MTDDQPTDEDESRNDYLDRLRAADLTGEGE